MSNDLFVSYKLIHYNEAVGDYDPEVSRNDIVEFPEPIVDKSSIYKLKEKIMEIHDPECSVIIVNFRRLE